MSLRPAPAAIATPAALSLPRGGLLAAGALAAAAFAAVTAGLVEPPDIEGALTGLSHTLGAWTYVLVAALAFLETGAFVGLIVPGETAIVLGGVVAAQGHVNLGAMLVLAWLAAALGDLASFALGRRLGRRFLLAHGPRLGVTAPRLARVERFFARHGAKAILAGRFVGIVRAVAPFLAGASGLRLRAFLPWSLIGTAAWATTFTLVGFAFHRSFSAAADLLTHGALALAALATAALAWRAHRRASRPQSFPRP
jgi:membrane-associated protein